MPEDANGDNNEFLDRQEKLEDAISPSETSGRLSFSGIEVGKDQMPKRYPLF